MGILKNVRRLASLEQKNDVTWDGHRGWTIIRGVEEDTLPDNFEEYVIEGLRKNPVVSACVREMQTSLSEAPIKAFRKEGDDEVVIPNHDLEDLFRHPNRRDSYITFIERSLQYFIFGGNSIWRKRRNNAGFPVELLPIRPDRIVGADVDKNGFPTSFEIRIGDTATKTEDIPFDDIIHIPDVDPLNEVFGMPRIMAATMDIATDNEASNYVNEVLGNYGSPGTIVTIDGERAKRQMLERAEALWQEKFGPGRGRGKVAFIPGGEQVQQIGFNLRDLEFESLRQVTRESICASLGIDPMVVNITTAGRDGTLSGNEHREARRKLWVQTLIPLIRRWEAAINAFLTPEFGDIVARFDLSMIKALQEDRDRQVERARKMVQSGATIEEARAEMDLDPEVDPDHHFLLVRNNNVIPAGRFVEEGMTLQDIEAEAEAEARNNAKENNSEEELERMGEDFEDEELDALIQDAIDDAKPLPNPTDDEDEEEFVERCMGDDEMVQEFPDASQREAVCLRIFENDE